MLFSETLGAGQSIIIGGGKHSQLFILECSNSEGLDVKFKGTDIPEFRMYKGVPAQVNYRNAVIKNPHAASVTFKIYCAPTGVLFSEGRNVEAGPTSILGKVGVIGQPLSSDGGSITPFGASYKASALNGSGSNSDTIISAGANVNGAIIRNMVIWLTASASNGYAAVNVDGNIIGIEQEVNKSKNYFRDYYIEAGQALTAAVTGVAGNTANIYTSYDLL